MKNLFVAALALIVCGGARVSTPASSKVVGDYVEARTASVFAGACHYNGELVTTGRDAVAAWSFTSGTYNGTDLGGVTAMAAVSSQDNLSQNAARKSELVIDSSASDAQASAVLALLKEKAGAKLGEITAIRRPPISFSHAGRDYFVKSDHFANLSVQPMPNNECCAQSNLVWRSG